MTEMILLHIIEALKCVSNQIVMLRIGLLSGEIIVYLSHGYLEINSNQ